MHILQRHSAADTSLGERDSARLFPKVDPTGSFIQRWESRNVSLTGLEVALEGSSFTTHNSLCVHCVRSAEHGIRYLEPQLGIPTCGFLEERL
jgi:hypothetical protein